MLNSLISLYSYLLLNSAIAAAYIIVRSTLKLSFFNKKISQFQRLIFIRYSFFIVVVSFLLMPVITLVIPFSHNSNFHFEPIIKNATEILLQNSVDVHTHPNQTGFTHLSLPINYILVIFLLIGFGFSILKYIKNILVLQKIKRNAFCQHKINNVNILFSQTTEIPFCWSFMQNHFITIPNIFLEKEAELRLAIRHELQHIRQHDTYWTQFIMLVKLFCFWNPFIKLWATWLDELQEFSCDESIILRKKTSPAAYARCLINAASDTLTNKPIPQGVLGIHRLSKLILYRRINMLFNYRRAKTKKISILFAYIIFFVVAASTAYAMNGSSLLAHLSINQLDTIIQQSHLDNAFHISATPEVVSEINNIRGSNQARSFMYESLQRMKQYQPIIQDELKKEAMPNELLAIPLVESGYRPLEQNKNPMLAAGIWQIIPETARHLNLTINAKRDDRLDTVLATQAALAYLQELHKQFNDWKLAVIAYEIGEINTAKLIDSTGSRDAWVIAKSHKTPKNLNLEKFISMLDAAVIIMNNPSLVSERI